MPPDDQFELALPAPPVTGETPLVPARMVNEFVYCPRLAWLEWAAGEWADTAEFRNPHYHRASDAVETLDGEFLAATVRGLERAVLALAGPSEATP